MAHRLLRLALAASLAAAAAGGAWAQAIVASARPDSVDVTVYRDPDRSADEEIDLDFPSGYALVTETRRIRLPAGESEIRFEGVAGGLVPQSVIVTGLPEGVVERNRDAYLLSPGTLLDRSTGRRVTLRRTDIATGRVREMEAVIRTGAEGAVVIESAGGFEALRCTGLPETLVYPEVPPGLSPRPTLSVRARAGAPVEANVTLAYLATGFDWRADYIVALSEDGSRADLFAWLTLASGDETSFPDADTQAVAGRLNWQRTDPQEIEASPIELHCWRHSTTSDIPLEQFERMVPPPPPSVGFVQNEEFITVTGSRIPQRNLASFSPVAVIQAQQEELGALKLYRIPEPVTIAARSQKQVALLQRPEIAVRTVYRRPVYLHAGDGPQPAVRWLLARNREEGGLGVPLPAGSVALFAEHDGRPLLIGEGAIGDLAVGQEIEIGFGEAPGVTTEFRDVGPQRRRTSTYELTVRNDRAEPVRFESEIAIEDVRSETRLGRRNGRPLWTVDVPAHGTVVLRFRARHTN